VTVGFVFATPPAPGTCAWGPGCERVHDIFDEGRDGPNPLTSTDPVVLTTWHDDESLAEALGFIFAAAIPDDGFTDDCGATLGVAIGSAQWANARLGEWVHQWSAES